MFLRSLIFISVFVTSVCGQNQSPRSITCYMKYHHAENRAENSNAYLGYSYANSQITHYTTIDGQPCEQVGCTCFSYRKACSSAEEEANRPNHYSDCNESDRASRTIKWHRGYSSVAECDEMRRQPSIYTDLTCCAAALCNDQPGKVTNYVKPADAQPPQALHQNPNHFQHQQQPSLVSPTFPPRRHEPHSHRSTTTQRQQQQYPVYNYNNQNTPRDNFDRARSPPNSAATKLFSLSMQIFALLLAFLLI